MSFGLLPFSVKLQQVRKAVGSRSKSLLRELLEEFEEELSEDRDAVDEANEDDEFDPELPLEDALRHLVMDEERWDYEGAKYGIAIEKLCTFYGDFLPNDYWAGVELTWAESVSDALQDVGFPAGAFSILDHLIDRGSPIEIPEIDDVPLIGYLTLGEIPAALGTLSEERIEVIKHDQCERTRASLKQVRDWLETCLRDKTDLVCFYY